MKKHGILLLLLACLWITSPVVAVDHESAKGDQALTVLPGGYAVLQVSSDTILQYPTEITTLLKEEVTGLYIFVSKATCEILVFNRTDHIIHVSRSYNGATDVAIAAVEFKRVPGSIPNYIYISYDVCLEAEDKGGVADFDIRRSLPTLARR